VIKDINGKWEGSLRDRYGWKIPYTLPFTHFFEFSEKSFTLLRSERGMGE